jgi:hypothetical protein
LTKSDIFAKKNIYAFILISIEKIVIKIKA